VNPPLANTVGASYILYPLRFAIDWRFAPDPVTQVRPMLFLVDSDWAAPTGWGNSGAWQSKDGGNNWSRTLQYFQPWSIDLDPNTGRVYVTGTGTFVGGIYPTAQFSVYSDDGIGWHNNLNMAQKRTLWSVTTDPNNSSNIFFGTHGSGILYGPKP